MSQAIHPESDCKECQDGFQTGYNAAYCSKKCFNKSQGDKILRQIKHDHKLCASCFRPIKEVEEPTDEQLHQVNGMESTEAIIGYQYHTEHAEMGTKEKDTPGTRNVVTTTVCECGSQHNDDYLRSKDKETIKRFLAIFNSLDIDKSLDVEVLVKSLQENDWNYAIGEALQ